MMSNFFGAHFPICGLRTTDRYTASQLVWNARAVSRQLSRRAQSRFGPFTLSQWRSKMRVVAL